MRYITAAEILVNTMIAVYQKERRRMIDETDIKCCQELLWKKGREEGERIRLLGGGVFIDDGRVFKPSYFGVTPEEKKKIIDHYLTGDIIYHEEILSCLCPYQVNSLFPRYYMMYPWVEVDELYQLRKEQAWYSFDELANKLGERKTSDLETLKEYEKKISDFFMEELLEKIDKDKKEENSEKKLCKMLLKGQKNWGNVYGK